MSLKGRLGSALIKPIGGEAEVLREATIDLAKHRDHYIADRAYRLLSAAVAGTAVQSIPPERRELFTGEESIGRMPIEQYLRVLAGDGRSGSPDMPYFENPRKMVSVTLPIRRSKHSP